MRGFSQDHGDGHPLVAMPLTEPSLSPPQCGARCSFAMHQHVDHYKARKINKRVNLSERVVVVWCGVEGGGGGVVWCGVVWCGGGGGSDMT